MGTGASKPPTCDGSFTLDFNAWIARGVDPALVAGTAVYVLARDWAPVLFLAPLADWQPGRLGLFGQRQHVLAIKT